MKKTKTWGHENMEAQKHGGVKTRGTWETPNEDMRAHEDVGSQRHGA